MNLFEIVRNVAKIIARTEYKDGRVAVGLNGKMFVIEVREHVQKLYDEAGKNKRYLLNDS